ncbi:MAG: hypothetical protein ABI068_00075 [Ktedonobacterales bacterium]
MNAVGTGYGSPTEHDTGIARALLAYATQGGALLGAHRWAENPLTLTHVRWQGVNGEIGEAFRPPERDYEIDATEREVWVEVAVLCAPDGFGQSGQTAPWSPIHLDRAQAHTLAQRVQQAKANKQSAQMAAQLNQMNQISQGGAMRPGSLPGYIPPHLSGQPSNYPYDVFGAQGAPPSQPLNTQPLNTYPGSPQQMQQMQQASQYFPMEPQASAPPRPSFAPASSALTSRPSMPAIVDALPSLGEQNSANNANSSVGGWQRGALESTAEVSVLVCIEIEMPVLIPGAASDYTRDFARDVTTHFSRAARSLPQTREQRGWMRGGRIVLAARLGMAHGNRQPTRVEMEHGAMALSDALAHRTLPYSRLTFADPTEWAQGTPLPNVG